MKKWIYNVLFILCVAVVVYAALKIYNQKEEYKKAETEYEQLQKKEKNIDFHLLDAKDIFDHYHNDPIYEKYINEYYWSMANGIYNLQYAYDPEKIVIGGGISMRDDLIDEINQRLDVIFKTFTHAHVRPIILTCQYHNDANLIGALFHYLTKSTSV